MEVEEPPPLPEEDAPTPPDSPNVMSTRALADPPPLGLAAPEAVPVSQPDPHLPTAPEDSPNGAATRELVESPPPRLSAPVAVPAPGINLQPSLPVKPSARRVSQEAALPRPPGEDATTAHPRNKRDASLTAHAHAPERRSSDVLPPPSDTPIDAADIMPPPSDDDEEDMPPPTSRQSTCLPPPQPTSTTQTPTQAYTETTPAPDSVRESVALPPPVLDQDRELADARSRGHEDLGVGDGNDGAPPPPPDLTLQSGYSTNLPPPPPDFEDDEDSDDDGMDWFDSEDSSDDDDTAPPSFMAEDDLIDWDEDEDDDMPEYRVDEDEEAPPPPPEEVSQGNEKEQDCRWQIVKTNKYGAKQKRIVELRKVDKTLLLFDLKKNLKVQVPLAQVETVKGQNGTRQCDVVFKENRRNFNCMFGTAAHSAAFRSLLEDLQMEWANEAVAEADTTKVLKRKKKAVHVERPTTPGFLDYHVMIKTSVGTRQRILVLNSMQILILDPKRKLKKRYALEEVYSLEVPTPGPKKVKQSNAPSALYITFNTAAEKPLCIFFSGEFDRLHFSDQCTSFNREVFVQNEGKHSAGLGVDVDDNNLEIRFSVVKTNKMGLTLKRVLALVPGQAVLRSFNKKKTYKDMQLNSVKTVERDLNHSCRVRLTFSNRGSIGFCFIDTVARERFLHFCRQIVDPLIKMQQVERGIPQAPAVEDHALSIFTGTWNLGDASPGSVPNLEDFIPPNEFDIYAIGFQEMTSKGRDEWMHTLKCHIMQDPKHDPKDESSSYFTVATVRLWEILVTVIAKRCHAHKFSNLEEGTVACGVGDIMGNKGGAAVSFCIENTAVCFIVSHLAARAERLPQRRDNYLKIVRGLRFGKKDLDIVNQHDHVFWFGDLNYRTTYKGFHETVKLVEQKNYATLVESDQLRQEMAKGAVFAGYAEGQINWAPTYRWERKQNVFSNKKEQPPSYTDRVLWHSLHPRSLDQLQYFSAPDMFGSDHRPVAATFSLRPRLAGSFMQPEPSIEVFLVMDDVTLTVGDLIPEDVPLFLTLSSGASATPITTKKVVGFEGQWRWGANIKLDMWPTDLSYLETWTILLTFHGQGVDADKSKVVYGHATFPLSSIAEQKSTFQGDCTKDGALIGVLSGSARVTRQARARVSKHSKPK